LIITQTPYLLNKPKTKLNQHTKQQIHKNYQMENKREKKRRRKETKKC